MRKRILSLATTLAMAISLIGILPAFTASAETVAEGKCGSTTWTLDSEGVLTISGEGAMASPSVSNMGSLATVEKLKAQRNDYDYVYTYKKYAEDIKEVIIEEGVTSIGFCAFYKMPNLETVVLPSTVSEFKGIGFVTDLGTPNINDTDISAYANFAFAECTSLKSLTLTEGMIAIGGFAFYGCTSLESVRIPTTIKKKENYDRYWDVYSFAGCSSLKNITLPEGLITIGAYAFSETAVESVVIPSTIIEWETSVDMTLERSNSETKHNNSAFAGCTKLSSVTFTDGLKAIKNSPFYNCPLLKKVAIPASITDLYYAFAYCNSLQEAYIEDGAQIEIGFYATTYGFDYSFFNCENLTKLEIPEGATIDYQNAQWNIGCSSLTDLYLHGKEYKSLAIPQCNDFFKYHCYTDSTVYRSSSISDDRKVNLEEEITACLDMVKTNVDKAKTYDEEKYTPESYAPLKELIEKAEKFDENSSILNMEWTAADIISAIKKLEKKPEETSSDPTDDTSDPSETSSDPSETSSDPASDDSSNPTDDQTQPTSAPTTAKPASTTTAPKATTAPTVKATVAKPAKVAKVKATAKKKKLNVSWKKVSGATGYEVLTATNNKFTKNKKTVDVKKNKAVIKKLKAKKKYFVKVRAYKTVNGTKYYGKWSKVVKKKTK